MLRDHLKLQFIIVLWGFTAVLGALISLPAAELVVFRTGIAFLVFLLMLRRRVMVPPRDAFFFFATGLIIGIHWVTFFLAVKVANVSICMVGLATLSLWTALLEPAINRRKKFRKIDLIFGTIVASGVVLIFRSELHFSYGFIIALVSSFMAAVFSVINSFHVKRAHHQVITFYEMLGAFVFAVLALPFMKENLLMPSLNDWGYLIILSVFCTVMCYSYYIELLKRLSVFTINFANNLEPVYGILLAALILKDYEYLGSGFYLGATIIMVSVAIYPFVRMKLRASSQEDASTR